MNLIRQALSTSVLPVVEAGQRVGQAWKANTGEVAAADVITGLSKRSKYSRCLPTAVSRAPRPVTHKLYSSCAHFALPLGSWMEQLRENSVVLAPRKRPRILNFHVHADCTTPVSKRSLAIIRRTSADLTNRTGRIRESHPRSGIWRLASLVYKRFGERGRFALSH